jgi:AraC family transcriptional regulator
MVEAQGQRFPIGKAAMPECQIYGRNPTTGKPEPLGKPEWVITSSSNSPWRDSFEVERHFRPAFEQTEVAMPATICLFGDAIKEQGLMEWRLAGSPLHGKLLQSGDVSVVSEGTPVWANHFGRTDITFISFNPDLLATATGESMPRGDVELKTQLLIKDERIRALGSLLEKETRAGCPTGRLYGESLGMALAADVIRRYSVFPPRAVEYKGGLSKYRLRRILDYIKSNLAEGNGLQELAELAGISAFHFCRSFKQSTGLSPHQYTLQLRIKEGQRLLRTTELSIAEVAYRVGFCDQSHFTMIFRRFVGTTPLRWRAAA